ncbi:thioredoxin family protein [Shewanella cutis]|uniref:Thioredoxin family protein n=1 Tax=Shewanella cutis TaxID=2766780 RepID=A0ABS9R2H9_9GAMM|nr:thioredoxin family protein [Shewanella sp. PS-2]MCG9966008.1 thioredoxin family protein [Shewanella sp. PS-2]
MKKSIQTIFMTFVFGLFFNAAHAMGSAESMAFTEQAWKEAQRQNQVTLLIVHADWCPTCKAQHKILSSYFQENPNSKINQLIIDFDTQKDWVTHFKAPRQSTLVLYEGDKQIWFSVAETRKDTIFKALKNAENAM